MIMYHIKTHNIPFPNQKSRPMLPTPLPSFPEFISLLHDNINDMYLFKDDFPSDITYEIIQRGRISETLLSCCFIENYIACVDIYFHTIKSI